MKNDYDFFALIYDPALYMALKRVRVAVMKELLQYKEKAILDLCCGTGNQLKMLSENGFTNLHCLDRSEAMLKKAKKSNCKMKIYSEDATKTSFENELFDIVILSFAIHEKDRTTQKRLIREAHRLLKRDGIMLVVDFVIDNKTNKMTKILINIVERMAGKEHYINFKNYIRNNGLSGLIKEDRFRLIKCKKKLSNGVALSLYKK